MLQVNVRKEVRGQADGRRHILMRGLSSPILQDLLRAQQSSQVGKSVLQT